MNVSVVVVHGPQSVHAFVLYLELPFLMLLMMKENLLIFGSARGMKTHSGLVDREIDCVVYVPATI